MVENKREYTLNGAVIALSSFLDTYSKKVWNLGYGLSGKISCLKTEKGRLGRIIPPWDEQKYCLIISLIPQNGTLLIERERKDFLEQTFPKAYSGLEIIFLFDLPIPHYREQISCTNKKERGEGI